MVSTSGLLRGRVTFCTQRHTLEHHNDERMRFVPRSSSAIHDEPAWAGYSCTSKGTYGPRHRRIGRYKVQSDLGYHRLTVGEEPSTFVRILTWD